MKSGFFSELSRRLSNGFASDSGNMQEDSKVPMNGSASKAKEFDNTQNFLTNKKDKDTSDHLRSSGVNEERSAAGQQHYQVISVEGDEMLDGMLAERGREYDFECIPISGDPDSTESFADEAYVYQSSLPGHLLQTTSTNSSNSSQAKGSGVGKALRISKRLSFPPSCMRRAHSAVLNSPCGSPSSRRGSTFSDAAIPANCFCRRNDPEECCTSFMSSSVSMKGLIRICGQDAKGRPIVVIDASCIPPQHMRSAALKHIRGKMDPVADAGEYNLIFVMSPNPSKGDICREVPTWWCLEVYRKLPLQYRKNIHQVLFIHPTFYAKVVCSILRPFLSRKAHVKIRKVDQLADLGKVCGGDISLDVLHLDTHVYMHDQVLATESEHLAPYF